MVRIQWLPSTTPSQPAGLQDTVAAWLEARCKLAETSDGLTAYVWSPAKGVWTAPDGHTEHDDVVMVEIVTDTFDRQWWHTYAATLAARFGQDTIHVRALSIQTPEE